MGIPAIQPAIAVVDRLLKTARRLSASDLHLDPTEEGFTVVARRDGVLEDVETVPASLARQVVGRLKALADLLAYRTDVPQEGRIAADRSDAGIEVRVATFPTLLGERVALRFDTPEGAPQSLASLGLAPRIEQALRTSLAQPDGVVLLTGPSGSGKTTTLYACLRELVSQDARRSLFTIEDPVERRIPGVTQTQVNPAAEFDFGRALRSMLRQDPDVILVGEIRDEETAGAALEAGLTGHLVASTIHAGTGPQVFARLLEMGVEPFVITTAMRGVLSQRLLRRADADGNPAAGRVVCAEWMPMSAPLRAAVHQRADVEVLAAAAAEGGYRTLREEAQALVKAGVTTQQEVDRVLGTL